MIIPISFQSAFIGALSLAGLSSNKHKDVITKGEILDYSGGQCIDELKRMHCTKPFMLEKSTSYNFEWKTVGNVLAHTTLELRDVKNPADVAYYRETNGDWTAEKTGLFYLDFKPLKPVTGNNTVEYTVKLTK